MNAPVVARVRRRDRCNQCNRPIDPRGRRNCARCRERLRLWSTDRAAYFASRKPRLILQGVPAGYRATWVRRSGDKKLGGIPATLVTPTTCPPSCAFYGAGCYGEHGFLASHWRAAGNDGAGIDVISREVAALPPGALWRYAIVGDLPGVGDDIDVAALEALVSANTGRRGFTYTHKPLRSKSVLDAVKSANQRGFTINLSADHIEDVERLRALEVAPVVVSVPSDHPERSVTTAGTRVQVCPAQVRAVTCATCRLCARPDRTQVVAFRAHGQMRAEINRRTRRLPIVSATD